MKLQDLENIEDYYIDEGFLCIKLISGDHLRINFNSIEAIKKQFSIPDVSNRRELLIDFFRKVSKVRIEDKGNMHTVTKAVDEYLKDN